MASSDRDASGILRHVFVTERKRRKWTQAQTATEIVRDGGATTLTKQGFSHWESGETELRLDQWASWARVLGMHLDVDLSRADDDGVSVRVSPSIAETCRILSALVPADQQVIHMLVMRLQRHS